MIFQHASDHVTSCFVVDLGCVDDPKGYKGYNCSSYGKTYCPDTKSDDWSKNFQAACKDTCSRHAFDYCNIIICKGRLPITC